MEMHIAKNTQISLIAEVPQYELSLKHNLDAYESLKAQYDEMTGKEEFDYIVTTLPFRFLKARYILETLALYAELKAQITVKTGEEAVTQYFDIIGFKHEKDELLDHAAYMQEVISLKNQINALVKGNPYLTEGMTLPDFGRLEVIVHDCLKEVPRYQSLMTKAFRIHFIESCLNTLHENDLNHLLKNRVMSAKDLDHIRLTGSEKYMHNIRYLCEITGHEKICVKEVTTKIKGTSFKNEDGSDRQSYLKALAGYAWGGKTPKLMARPYLYQSEGKEEPAIGVFWEDKCLGNIAKEIATEILTTYENPELEVTFDRVVGGKDSNLSYGCQIVLKVYAIQSIKISANKTEAPAEIESVHR